MVRRSWNAMREIDLVTLLNGSRTVNMPDDFKELTADTYPIGVYKTAQEALATGSQITPCVIYTPEKLIRLRSSWGNLISATTGRDRKISISIDVQDGEWMIALQDTATEDIVFQVRYYKFLPLLKADADENMLTRDYPEVIINRAKSIAFGLINDPEGITAEQRYELEFQKALRTDAHAAFAGRGRRT